MLSEPSVLGIGGDEKDGGHEGVRVRVGQIFSRKLCLTESPRVHKRSVFFWIVVLYNFTMKNIIFDWSGVVRDTVTNQMWIVNHIFKKHGIGEISTEEFRENWKQPAVLFYQKYLPEGYNEKERSKLFQKLQLDKDCPKATSFSEVVKLIHKCKKKGYFLAVVSSDFPETLLPEVKEYGLENIFNEIITDANDKLEPVQKIIQKYNLNL